MGTLPDLEGPPRAAALKRHADDLLATPMDTGSAEGETFQRATAEYSNRSKRFLVPSRGFERQYAQLYFARLMQLGPAVSAAAQAAWPGVQPAKILNVQVRQQIMGVWDCRWTEGSTVLMTPMVATACQMLPCRHAAPYSSCWGDCYVQASCIVLSNQPLAFFGHVAWACKTMHAI